MNNSLFDVHEERKVVRRICDWHEYHVLGVPVGFFRNVSSHGFSKALKYHLGMSNYMRSEKVKEFRDCWIEEEKEHARAIRDGEESGLYRFQHPVDFELERRRTHRYVTALLEDKNLVGSH